MKKILLLLFAFCGFCFAEEFKPQYYEKPFKDTPLPNILRAPSSRMAINAAADWESVGRPETLKIFESEIYGKIPPRPAKMGFEIIGKEIVSNGEVSKEKIRTLFTDKGREKEVIFTLYRPIKITNPSMIFAGLSLGDESGVIAEVIKNSAVLTAEHSQFFADKAEAASDSSAIAVWAWGLSRMMDYVETRPDLDAKKVVVAGHSRLGKAALVAAAYDKRFAICIANNSGCMGASLSRREFGETTAIIAKAFPHWFCKNFSRYAKTPEMLPVDQHQLLAAIAPRPLYIASASEDEWADPKGELLSLIEASKIYALYGVSSLPTLANFELENPFFGKFLGYHLRKGPHALTPYDWSCFYNFAREYFYN